MSGRPRFKLKPGEIEALEADAVLLRRAAGSFVVKVQLSLATSRALQQVLAYNRSRTILWEDAAPARVLELMGARAKAFFRAHLQDDGQLSLDQEVPDEEW